MTFPRFLLCAMGAVSLAALAAPVSAASDGCKPGNSYPPSLVKSFSSGCMEKPSYEKFCNCVMTNLQKEMSLYDFIEVSNTEKIETDKRFLKATGACMTEFPTAELNNAAKPAAGNAAAAPATPAKAVNAANNAPVPDMPAKQ